MDNGFQRCRHVCHHSIGPDILNGNKLNIIQSFFNEKINEFSSEEQLLGFGKAIPTLATAK